MKFVLILFCALILTGASCRTLPEDQSAFASIAGENTAVFITDPTLQLGSCDAELNKGWGHCLIGRGGAFPSLFILMTNPGEWAVGDCQLGIYKTGSTSNAELVTVDTSGLVTQANQFGFCLLKIETVEHYSDPRDSSQIHSIPMRGGFFVELTDSTYLPTPSKDMIAWCQKVMRTTKGRTTIESCAP